MAVFAYKAVDARERWQRGTLAADTPALARQVLRARGLAVASLEAAEPRSPRRWRLRLARRPAEQLTELWRDLAVLLAAGVPLAEALGVCLRQQHGAVQTVVRQLLDAVRGGHSLTDALALHPGWFDALTRAIVRVGERSGVLAESLANLAEYHARRRATVGRLTTALIYPVILCAVGSGVVVFLMSHVVPQLVEVLTSAGRELPAPTRVLKAVSDALTAHGLLGLGGLIGLIITVGLVRRSAWGQRLLERGALRVPVLGELLRRCWIARITMMLATLLRADVRFVEALRTVRAGLPHRLYAEELERLAAALEAGARLAAPLRASRLIPPLVAQLLAVGQESGELPRMLDQLRDNYEQGVQLALARFLAVLEPALILVLATVIGFVLFATLLPILETTRVMQ